MTSTVKQRLFSNYKIVKTPQGFMAEAESEPTSRDIYHVYLRNKVGMVIHITLCVVTLGLWWVLLLLDEDAGSDLISWTFLREVDSREAGLSYIEQHREGLNKRRKSMYVD